uniref:TF-B3 domain-containing protein n=1 Tax=Kalanchoe fedtschenkoi TaxID=63787 RepID=A0A7N0U7K0_KALFE
MWQVEWVRNGRDLCLKDGWKVFVRDARCKFLVLHKPWRFVVCEKLRQRGDTQRRKWWNVKKWPSCVKKWPS